MNENEYIDFMPNFAYGQFIGKLAVVVNKDSITFVGSTSDILCKTGWVGFKYNPEYWAMFPCDRARGFKVKRSSPSGHGIYVFGVHATRLINILRLPRRGAFVGELENSEVIRFSRKFTQMLTFIERNTR